jgi:hypothetical protein
MITLADLNEDEFVVIARKVRSRDGRHDVWDYLLDVPDRNAMFLAREAGRIITGQERGADGVVRLKAKLARRGPRRVRSIDFETVGKGMFE